jgi:hypothetical protein
MRGFVLADLAVPPAGLYQRVLGNGAGVGGVAAPARIVSQSHWFESAHGAGGWTQFRDGASADQVWGGRQHAGRQHVARPA